MSDVRTQQFVLSFDPCRKLKLAFAEFTKQAEAQAQSSARAAEEKLYREAYNARHSAEGPKRA